jgi:hypothetical protein
MIPVALPPEVALSGIGFGAFGADLTIEKDDLRQFVRIPRDEFVIAGALFGATAAAWRGATSAKGLLTGASLGVVALSLLGIATGRY